MWFNWHFFIFFSFLIGFSSFGETKRLNSKKNFTKEEKQEILEQLDAFYDKNYDYKVFTGRVTDKDSTNHIFKVSSENKNAKFFRAGDRLKFHIATMDEDETCDGFIRSVEDGYFVIYVKILGPCWKGEEYFRRGNMLVFKSKKLAQRVREAALYRVVLLKRRKDFFKQLNGINHFIWSFDQQKVLTATDYDKKIVELEKAKLKALDRLIEKKKDSSVLQRELMVRIDQLDKDLEFYRIDKSELMIDRWHLDHNLGLPVGNRPQELKKEEE